MTQLLDSVKYLGVTELDDLSGRGRPFEIGPEDVLGEQLDVFVNRHRRLAELLEASRVHGDREYVVFDDTRLTYTQHYAAVAALATRLRDEYAIGPGTRVAILAANGAEWVVAFWATVSLGAVAVALNAWWSGPEIAYALGNAQPRLIVVDADGLARLTEPPECSVLDVAGIVLDADGGDVPAVDGAEDDPAVILYTSGTTGFPKGAVHSHRNIVALVQAQALIAARRMVAFGLSPTATFPMRIFTTNPLFHVSGLHSSTIAGLASGVTHVWCTGRFDPVVVMQMIERERCTNWTTVPTAVHRVVSHPDVATFDLSSMRHIGGGGSAWSPVLQERIRDVFGTDISSGLGYGLTECNGLATVASAADLRAHPTTVGAAVPTVQVEIRDAEGKPVPDGDEGEIHIRSPLVMRGYWRNDDATAAVIGPGRWLRSGDLGHLDDGLLYLSSRRYDLIIRGGENVYPVEIENVLEGHPGVAESVVVGTPHDDLGQEVTAVVVPRPGASVDAAALTAYVREQLAYFKVPSRWVFRETPLPRTATDKVVRADVLRDLEGTA